MGLASCNKSTGDMLTACSASNEQVKLQQQQQQSTTWAHRRRTRQVNGASRASRFERLKQASWAYLLASGGPAAATQARNSQEARGKRYKTGSSTSKSLASTSSDDDDDEQEAGELRRRPLLLEQQRFDFEHELELGHNCDALQVNKSNCYIWPTANCAGQQLEEAPTSISSAQPEHIRPASSSPMLHDSLISATSNGGGGAVAQLEHTFARPPPVGQRRLTKRASLSQHNLAACERRRRARSAKRAQRQERPRRRRKAQGGRQVACDSDSDSCASGELATPVLAAVSTFRAKGGALELADARRPEVLHHGGQSAAAALMLRSDNCRPTTIDVAAAAGGNCSRRRRFSAELTRDSSSPLRIEATESDNGGLGETAAAQPGHSQVAKSGGADGRGGEPPAGRRAAKNNGRPASRRNSAERQAAASSAPNEKWAPVGQVQVCRNVDGPTLRERLSEQQPISSSRASSTATNSKQHREAPPMGLDLVAGRLAGGWRQASTNLLGALPNSSGSYKVAQQQQFELLAASKSPLAQHQPRGQACDSENKRQQVATSSAGNRRRQPTSRSPVALQRQTHARLTRHKLKIQQQRQEQLANLAQRERQQFQRTRSSLRAPDRRTPVATSAAANQYAEPLEIEVLSSSSSAGPGSRTRGGSLEHSLNYFKTLFLNRLPATLNPIGRRQSCDLAQHSQQAASNSNEAFTRFQTTNRTSQLPRHCAIDIPEANPTRGQPAPGDQRRDLARVLAQANVIVHRSPVDLVVRQRGDAGRGSGQQEVRSAPTTNQQAANSSPQQFQFRFSHMAGQQANESSGGGGPRRNKPTMSTSHNDDDKRDAQSTTSSTSSTLSLNRPFCKICHLSSSKQGDKLISPCKCSGTLQHIHCGCLLKWLEISNRANERQPMSCELCAHEYTWHKRFNYKQMKLPRCSLKDILLHTIFVLALGLMVFCALAPVFHTTRQIGDELGSSMRGNSGSGGQLAYGGDQLLLSGAARRAQFRTPSSTQMGAGSSAFNGSGGKLANDEKFILMCAALFFVAFFVAIYTQTKARDTLYGLIVKFANMNLTYYITEYDHGQQQQHHSAPSSKTDHNAATAASLCQSRADDNNRDLSQRLSGGGAGPQAHVAQVYEATTGQRVTTTSSVSEQLASPSNTRAQSGHKSQHLHY